MKAAVITGPRAVEIRQVNVPVPAPDEVLIRLEGCGVCGSNLPVWQGRPWFRYPLEPGAPGHEGWGLVAAVGPDVAGIEVGDRVATVSQHSFAEYDVSRRDQLVLLPSSLGALDLPAEPLGCAMNIWRRSMIRQEHTVAVVGVGFIGALLIELAHRAGARVFAISRRPWVLELARDIGAEEAFVLDEAERPGSDDLIVSRIEELTGGAGCDRVIEAVGLQRPLDLATRLTRVRGRLIIAGYHQDGPRIVDMHEWNWRGIDVINAHERDTKVYIDGMRAAVDAMESGALDLGPLISHRIELARIGEAFSLLESRPRGFVKAEITA